MTATADGGTLGHEGGALRDHMADADNELRRRLVVLAEESKGQAAINLIQAISCKVGERTETKVRMSASEAVGKLTGEEVEALLAEHSNC